MPGWGLEGVKYEAKHMVTEKEDSRSRAHCEKYLLCKGLTVKRAQDGHGRGGLGRRAAQARTADQSDVQPELKTEN